MRIKRKSLRDCILRARPMPVREYRQYNRDYVYALCPRCQVTMEGEYVAYCVYCGQRLDWQEHAARYDAESEEVPV